MVQHQPLNKEADGSARAYLIVAGKSWLREACDKLNDDRYICGKPDDLSPEISDIFDHDDDEAYIGWNMTYQQYYNSSIFLVNYGKSVKSRVKKDRPFRYQGYVFKYSLAAFGIGEQEEIVNWLTKQEYDSVSEEDKKDYAYFEWNEWGDWYGVYNNIVHRVDALIEWFSEWSFCHLTENAYED